MLAEQESVRYSVHAQQSRSSVEGTENVSLAAREGQAVWWHVRCTWWLAYYGHNTSDITKLSGVGLAAPSPLGSHGLGSIGQLLSFRFTVGEVTH